MTRHPFAFRSARRIGLAVALLAMPILACAHRAPSGGAPGIAVAVTDSFTVQSRVLGETRPINVWTPAQYRAGRRATRLPVLYMPDGGTDEDFPHVVHVVDSLIAAGAIRPFIVVGIPNTQRRRDLTGPTRVASDSAIAPRVGGSAAFRQFIGDELMSEVERRYRTTGERAIVGESLAGLFIVETFLEQPRMFSHYVAFDPSLWWNHEALLDSAPTLLAALDATPRTLYFATSGDDVEHLGARFAALIRAAAPRGLAWSFMPRTDVTHATIFHALEAPALAQALR